MVRKWSYDVIKWLDYDKNGYTEITQIDDPTSLGGRGGAGLGSDDVIRKL